ncbi:hypothetical protein B0H16DRAFT_1699380 [Mycena metata]|uniref:Uncharacterized protein n=1 Tax=Mycena metata TaxID=1033252 RepID=A0AAD7HKA9_9AGAR|nr:hypothetical protein B0H16DRAFT_1699380 [Mycena metata]
MYPQLQRHPSGSRVKLQARKFATSAWHWRMLNTCHRLPFHLPIQPTSCRSATLLTFFSSTCSSYPYICTDKPTLSARVRALYCSGNFGWVLSSRTPNEPAPILGEERPWRLGFSCAFPSLSLTIPGLKPSQIFLVLSLQEISTVIFGLLLAFHSVKSPIFTALASSCTAVGFRAHACAPLGMLAFLPIAEIFTFICASVIIRRLGVVRYGSAMVQLPVPPPPPPPPPQYAAAWAIVGVVELDKPVISAQLGVPLAAPRAGFGFGF